MVSTTNLIAFIIFGIVMLILGIIIGRLQKRKIDGRLVIDEAKDEYFIAITTKPEELTKRKQVIFKVISQ